MSEGLRLGSNAGSQLSKQLSDIRNGVKPQPISRHTQNAIDSLDRALSKIDHLSGKPVLIKPKYRVKQYSVAGNGCNYYRQELATKYLKKDIKNWNIEFNEVIKLGDSAIKEGDFLIPAFDLAVFHRAMTEEQFKYAVAMGKSGLGIPIIYEIDDLLDSIDINSNAYSNCNSAQHGYKLKVMSNFMRYADALTVTTENLKRRLSKYNDNIYVIPNALDNDIWNKYLFNICEKERIKRCNAGQINIGWFGSSTHYSDLEPMLPALKIIGNIFPYVNFIFAGWDLKRHGKDLLADWPETRYKILPWQSNMNFYAEQFKHIDIGIAPLKDNAFNSCKSNIKILEYWAAGVPVVASRLAPYENDVRDGVNGYLVKAKGKQVDRWVKKLTALINAREIRLDMGKEGHDYVMENYSMANTAPLWHNAFSSEIEKAKANGRLRPVDMRIVQKKVQDG